MVDGIIEGKEGWLFQEWEDVLKYVTAEIPITSSQVDQWKKLMNQRIEMSRAFGAGYLMFVAPEKHVVYADMLPDDIKVSPMRAAVVLEDVFWYLEGLFRYVPGSLSNLPGGTYSKCGTHWNGYGAYLAYRDMCKNLNRLGQKQVPIKENGIDIEFCLRPCDKNSDLHIDVRYQDLGSKMEPVRSDDCLVPRKLHPKGRCIFDNMKFARGNIKVYSNKDKSLPTLVLFRDSFAGWLLPLLAESFSRIVAISSWHYLPTIVESERPDFVVTECAERYLISQDISDDYRFNVHDFLGMVPEDIKAKCNTRS